MLARFNPFVVSRARTLIVSQDRTAHSHGRGEQSDGDFERASREGDGGRQDGRVHLPRTKVIALLRKQGLFDTSQLGPPSCALCEDEKMLMCG